MLTDTKVQLISSDNKTFEVETRVIQNLQLLKDKIENTGTSTATIPLFDVSSKILTKVIEYCKYHVESQEGSNGNQAVLMEEIMQWDADFCKIDYDTLVGLIRAAKYLNIKSLHDLGCRAYLCWLDQEKDSPNNPCHLSKHYSWRRRAIHRPSSGLGLTAQAIRQPVTKPDC